MAGLEDEGILSIAATKRVVAAPAGQEVGITATEHGIVSAAAIGTIVAILPFKTITAPAVLQAVVVETTGQDVVAAPP